MARTRTRSTESDLGFGSQIGAEVGQRLLNPDGTYTVKRVGMGWRGGFGIYQFLMRTSWPRFLLMMLAFFLSVNVLYAFAYMACGADAIINTDQSPESFGARFCEAFFLSVHTITSVGYGHIHPASLASNLVMTLEAFTGLIIYALATGLSFARASHPRPDVGFSDHAVLAPYRDKTAFMFRLVNRRRTELMNLHVRVVVSWLIRKGSETRRSYEVLDLERTGVAFFPMTWTVVHPIDESSPFHQRTTAELRELDAEILVAVDGTDEATGQQVILRTSYKPREIIEDHRFADIFDRNASGLPLSVDVRRLDEVLPA
ncbi:MAG: ion channel [Planctomycetota bacterium]|nr:ion channel [Planctomycetota bacterium]